MPTPAQRDECFQKHLQMRQAPWTHRITRELYDEHGDWVDFYAFLGWFKARMGEDKELTGTQEIDVYAACLAAYDAGRGRSEGEMAGNDDWLDDCIDDTNPCDLCGGERFVEYQECPEAWGEDSPSLQNHLVTCPQCGGSGKETP